MSEVSKFLEAIPDLDEALKIQINTTTQLEDLVNIAKQAGYSFTTAELCTEVQQLNNDRREELNFLDSTNLPMELSEGVAGLDVLSSEILRLCDQQPAQHPPAKLPKS
jgi:predicted ribosomally synthesized peptide with nif11-like leader